MRKCLIVSSLIILLPLVALAGPPDITTVQRPDVPSFLGWVPGELIVQFKVPSGKIANYGMQAGKVVTGIESLDALAASYGVAEMEPLFKGAKPTMVKGRTFDLSRYFVVRFDPAKNLDEVMAAYQKNRNVISVEKNGIHTMYATPNDGYFSYQWHLTQANDHDVDAPEAWDVQTGSTSIILAILDSGTRYYHPDLGGVNASPANPGASRGNMWINTTELNGSSGVDDDGNGYVDDWIGWDFIDGVSNCWTGEDCNTEDNDPRDFNGHGTHTAGIVGMITNDGYGMAGIAGGWGNGSQAVYGNGVKVMPLRMGYSYDYLGQEYGVVQMDAAASAFYYAANNGARIASCSWGSSNSGGIGAAVDYFIANDGLVFVAAGNDGSQTADYLNGRGDCISVAATDQNDAAASFTTYGTWVDICAPGVGIYATYHDHNDPNTNYWAALDGTSMACPLAAGVGALIWSQNPGWSASQVETQLYNSSDDIDAYLQSTHIGKMGAGRVNAYNAVNTGGGSAPVADFSGSPTSGDAPLSVSFTDFSSNSPTSWSWDFGDGGSSNAQNPSHTYNAAGTYTVSLTATNAYGSDTETKTGYITVTTPTGNYANLPYSTGFESGSLDQYWTTQSNNSEGRILITTANSPRGSYHMTMDDNYNGGLYAQNEAWLYLDLSGHSAVDLSFYWKEFSDEDHTQDGVYFSDDGGASFTKVYNLTGGTSTYQQIVLDVDQLASSNGLNLTGTFVVKFQQYDNYAITTDGMAFDDVEVYSTASPPTADFSGSPTSGDAPLSVQFTDLSSGTPTSWSWDFGDGGSSTAQNPSHTYNSAGTYTVSLTATNAYGSDTETKTGYITVTEPSTGDYASLPYSTGFETGSLDQYWTTQSDNSEGRILVTSANSPRGAYHLTMDDNYNGGAYAQNEAWLHVDLAGETNVDLTFWWKEFADEDHTQDGVFFSDDGGATFTKVYSLVGGSSTYQQIALDVDALASSNGLTLSSTFVIKFQQYDNYGISTDGMAFDDVSVTAAADPYAALSYSTGFETGAFDNHWETYSTGDGRVQLVTAYSPRGSYHMTMDDPTSGGYTTNEAWLLLNLSGHSQVDLTFYWKEFADESHSTDGVYLSDNGGASFVKVYNLTGGTSTYQQIALDIDALASSNGLTLSSTFVVKFQQYDNYPITTDGMAFDDIVVTGNGTSVAKNDGTLPDEFALLQNFPNPFNPATTISFALPEASDVELIIYNIAGQEVTRLINGHFEAGVHSIEWDASAKASGIYFYRLRAGDFVESKKMVLLK